LITTLKDLERLLKLCRKQGVTEIDLGVVKLKLGELPREEEESVSADEHDDIPPIPTMEELADMVGMPSGDYQ
jgi:hypothetical protein